MNIFTHFIINVTNKYINKKIKDSAEMNHDENKFKEDQNYTLGSSNEQGKICRVIGYIDLFFFGVFLLFYTYSVVFKPSGVAEIHSPEIGFGIVGIFLLLGLYLILYPNYEIEIKDSEIFKTNIFKYKRKIGNISEIDGFEETNTDIIVYKNNKKFFNYPIYGKEDNFEFSGWLKKKFLISNKFTIRGNQALYILMYIFSILWVFIILMCAGDEGIIESLMLFRNTFYSNISIWTL